MLAIGISGLQQSGGQFYVEPLFNGCTLIAAIALAAYAQRINKQRQQRANEQTLNAVGDANHSGALLHRATGGGSFAF